MPLIRRVSGLVRALLFTTVLSALALILPGPGLCFEITVVKTADLKPYEDVLQGVKDSCGCRVRVVTLSAEEGSEEVLRSGSPDAIVAIGTTAFKKAKPIRHLPLVYTMVMPSESADAVHPNISGVSMDISPGAYIASIKELFPNAKRIGVLHDPAQTGAFVREAVRAAENAGLSLKAKTVTETSKVPAALQELQGRIDVFWMIPDVTVVTAESVEYLLRFSFRHSLPVFSFSSKYVEMGAVAALDIDPYDMGVQAGEIVKTASMGRAESVRVYARSSALAVNEKVARKMGLVINGASARRTR